MKEMPAPTHTSSWTIGWARRSLPIVFSAAIVACSGSGDSPSGPVTPVTPTSPAGSYDIQTVNGKTVPVVVNSDGNYTNEVTASSVVLGTDGKYSAVMTTRITIPNNVQIYVDSTAGTWTQTGNSIQLTNALDGSKDSGTWDKGLLTFVEVDGKVTTTLVYLQKK